MPDYLQILLARIELYRLIDCRIFLYDCFLTYCGDYNFAFGLFVLWCLLRGIEPLADNDKQGCMSYYPICFFCNDFVQV